MKLLKDLAIAILTFIFAEVFTVSIVTLYRNVQLSMVAGQIYKNSNIESLGNRAKENLWNSMDYKQRKFIQQIQQFQYSSIVQEIKKLLTENIDNFKIFESITLRALILQMENFMDSIENNLIESLIDDTFQRTFSQSLNDRPSSSFILSDMVNREFKPIIMEDRFRTNLKTNLKTALSLHLDWIGSVVEKNNENSKSPNLNEQPLKIFELLPKLWEHLNRETSIIETCKYSSREHLNEMIALLFHSQDSTIYARQVFNSFCQSAI